MQRGAGANMPSDRLSQGSEQELRLSDPIGQRGASFGRTCWMTLKLEGTYSSTSRSSCPIRLNVVPPQPAQMQAGS
jgi:hypothetical protein